MQISHKKNTSMAPKKKSEKQPRKLEIDWRSKFAAEESTARKQRQNCKEEVKQQGLFGGFLFVLRMLFGVFLVLFWFGDFLVEEFFGLVSWLGFVDFFS